MSEQEKHHMEYKPETIQGNIEQAVRAIEKCRRQLQHMKRQDHPISEHAANILEFAEKHKHKNDSRKK